MDDPNLLEEGQVIYIDEDTMVLDGKEIQYVIPQSIAGKNTNMLVQEDGTSFTHYLLHTEGAATIEDKSHIVIQQAEFSNTNETSNTTVEDESQILQYNPQDEDVVAQVMLTEEQCRALQDCGSVIIQQGSRKFLLDAEGLKEVDPSYGENLDCKDMEGVISENEEYIETSGNLDGSNQIIQEEEEAEEPVKGECEDEVQMQEYIVSEDNKESVFEFLRDRCDIMETTDCVETEKNSESIYAENLSLLEHSEENESDGVSDGVSGDKTQQMKDDIKVDFEFNEKKIIVNSKSVKSVTVRKLVKTISHDEARSDKKIASSTNIKSNKEEAYTKPAPEKKSLTQIRDGKIVMMPEDAHTPYTKKLIKTHFAKNKSTKNPVKLHVLKNQNNIINKCNKLSLKNLKDYKIYIASTEDGKNIYGKIIDIIKPSQSVKKTNVFENKETNQHNTEPSVNCANETNLKVNNKYVNFSIVGKNICIPLNTTTNLNKIISEKEIKRNMLSNNAANDTYNFKVVGSNSRELSISEEVKPTVKYKMDLKYAVPPFQSESDMANIIVPSKDELEKLNEILSKLAKSKKVASCLTTRDILIIKETTSGTSEWFTGRILVTEEVWNFKYMPELWLSAQGSTNKTGALKNGNFLVLKMIKNETTGTTDIIIMDKAKYPWKKMEGTMVNSSKCIRKTLYCPYCKKAFYRTSCLSRHMAIHTVQQMGHKCTYCPCVFRYPSTLTRHLIEQHTGLTTN